MLIAFLALIAMVNGILGWVHTLPYMGWLPGSLQQIFGVVFAPVAWLLGVAWNDAPSIGNLLGTRLVLNEFVAFLESGPDARRSSIRGRSPSRRTRCAASPISARSRFRSAASARWRPAARSDLARLGLRAVAAGSMANFMSACIAGMLL